MSGVRGTREGASTGLRYAKGRMSVSPLHAAARWAEVDEQAPVRRARETPIQSPREKPAPGTFLQTARAPPRRRQPAPRGGPGPLARAGAGNAHVGVAGQGHAVKFVGLNAGDARHAAQQPTVHTGHRAAHRLRVDAASLQDQPKRGVVPMSKRLEP